MLLAPKPRFCRGVRVFCFFCVRATLVLLRASFWVQHVCSA